MKMILRQLFLMISVGCKNGLDLYDVSRELAKVKCGHDALLIDLYSY